MNGSPDEIPEQEFIERLRQREVIATRTQLRHLKRKGEIRGAVQRRVRGHRGSVSMYLASEVDRVAALLTVELHGRKTVERASREAWLQFGESALPLGMTSRSYIVSVLDQKRNDLASVPLGEQFLELVRNPVDVDTDEDGLQSEKGFALVEEALPLKQDPRALPLIELAMHAIVIKDYAAESELDEVDAVAKVLGPISTPQTNRRAYGEDEFRIPVSQILLDPHEYLTNVSDETIECARQSAVTLVESMRGLAELPGRLERLKQPTGTNAESLATLGELFSGPLATDPALVVAYLAKKLSEGGRAPQDFFRNLGAIAEGLANAEKAEHLIKADPSLLKKLEEITAERRNIET